MPTTAKRVDFATAASRLSTTTRLGPQERRRFRRNPIVVSGRVLSASGREFDCRTADISPGDVRIATPTPPEVGEHVVIYLEGYGRLPGRVARRCGETEVAIIPREELLALLYRDRDVSIRFIKMLSKEVRDTEERLLQLAYAPVRQRVAQALVRLRKRYGGAAADDLGVRISREDLATLVGTATESLIRTLTDLKEDGLIEVQGRDIRIKNLNGLERLANS